MACAMRPEGGRAYATGAHKQTCRHGRRWSIDTLVCATGERRARRHVRRRGSACALEGGHYG